MAVVIGTAMEHIAKATSSTAHIYKNLELGPQTGQVKLACNSYDPMFAEVVRATGSVSTVGQEESKAAASSQARGEESKAPAREESKTPAPAQALEQPQTIKKSEEDERILSRLGSEFQQMEMLTIIMGNFQQIKNFKERVIKVMKDIIPDEGRSKAGRKQILDKALKALKDNLSLPAESRESRLSEQFDPVLSVNEVCSKSLPSMLDELMDHEGDDASFIAMIRKNSGDLIAQIIGEIEEGFIDGMNDVLVFLKSLATELLMSSAPPQ